MLSFDVEKACMFVLFKRACSSQVKPINRPSNGCLTSFGWLTFQSFWVFWCFFLPILTYFFGIPCHFLTNWRIANFFYFLKGILSALHLIEMFSQGSATKCLNPLCIKFDIVCIILLCVDLSFLCAPFSVARSLHLRWDKEKWSIPMKKDVDSIRVRFRDRLQGNWCACWNEHGGERGEGRGEGDYVIAKDKVKRCVAGNICVCNQAQDISLCPQKTKVVRRQRMFINN